MSREEIRKTLYELLDLLNYADRIASLPDCNDCGAKRTCMYCPEIGQQVRINCPLWKPKENQCEQ